MSSFSSESESVLRKAGWAPGRRVDVSPWISAMKAAGVATHEAARQFLLEFGGLIIDISGPGITRAREPFELDPMQCSGEEERFLEWGNEIGRSIFPIGIFDEGRFFLGIDEEGEVYVLETWLASFGKFPEALENLITGVRAVLISRGEGMV